MKRLVGILLLLGVALTQSGSVTQYHAVVARKKASGTGLLTNLEAYYDFEETTGNAADSSGNSRTLTEQGTVPSTTGKLGNAREYTGSTSNIFTSTDAAFSPGSSHWSVALWLYADTLSQSSFPGIVGIRDSSNVEWFVLFAPNFVDISAGAAADGTAVTSVGTTGFSATTWTLIVATNINISKDGGAFVSAAFAGPVFSGTAQLEVGSRSDGSSAWDGRIDELAFWTDRALTIEDVGLIYNSGAGLSFSNW